jgi:hypothetical protein
MFKLFWQSADRQSDIPMGKFDTRAAAEAAIPAARAELLDQCGEDHQRAEVNAGRFEIVAA